ncbi:MAG: DUF692 domain-containing protein [Woeseiaceae bacterium]
MNDLFFKGTRPFTAGPVPVSAGIGLRHPHVPDFLESPPAIGWIEVHSENYLAAGGPRLGALEAIRKDYPLSCHGVGLSLGSHEGLDTAHLTRLEALFDRFEPQLVSEHVSWSVTEGVYLNDLLPLPYTEEALAVVCGNIDHAQEFFGRQILVENPSSYLRIAHSTMPEWEFMSEVARRTGCGILLDVNNVYVSAHNHVFDPETYLAAIPADAVREIHLAGHAVRRFGDETVLIDDHGSVVIDPVWRLFELALRRLGPLPTLIEWDANVPELSVLLGEAERAEGFLNALRTRGDGNAS